MRASQIVVWTAVALAAPFAFKVGTKAGDKAAKKLAARRRKDLNVFFHSNGSKTKII
jgi:hypothetical protein